MSTTPVVNSSAIEKAIKNLENNSTNSVADTKIGNAERPKLDEKTYQTILNILTEKKQIVLYGPPGTGKTWTAKRFIEEYLLKNAPKPKAVSTKQMPKYEKLGFDGFSELSFKFFSDLESNNNTTWMHNNKERFEKYVKEPLRNITDAIGKQCISKINSDFEIRADSRHTISRIMKNVYGKTVKNPYWPHLWSAFYRKSVADKTRDAQLFILINANELRFGLSFGESRKGHPFEKRFKDNIKKWEDDFLELVNDIAVPNQLDFEYRDESGKATVMQVTTKEELYQWTEKPNIGITRTYSPQKVVPMRVEQLVQEISDAFTLLYPFYLFSVETDPLEKVDAYVRESSIGAEGETDEIVDSNEKFVKYVSFHQSYSYEEFVEGIRPVLDDSEANNERKFIIAPGIFKSICESANSDQENTYFLVIDEINRGSISKIFGELITLLEKDKRNGPNREAQTNTLVIDLAYSKKPFSVPWNLYIIGTMNTSDKSIALVDVALRRRFGFLEVLPQPHLLNSLNIGGKTLNLEKILETLNKKISVLIDRDHQIGHSYLMNVNKDDKGNTITEEVVIIEKLRFRFYNEIIPLIQEYFYNDWERIKQVIKPFIKETVTVDQAITIAESATQGIWEVVELDDEKFLAALSELENG